MPPPSSGGIAVAATLGILEHFTLSSHKPTDVDLNGGRPTVMGVHLVSEAQRLAYADRDKYVADTDFVPLPGGSPNTLLNADYLAGRAALISEERSMGTAKPGEFAAPPATPPPAPEHGTSHISVIDAYGNAASLTTTVESAFGSFHMVDGFILNNQLTDFAAEPVGEDGTPVANRVQPGKRPRSSMAPTLVFDQVPSGRGPLYAMVGSAGGALIIQFVVKTVVGMQDWDLDPQQAVSMVDFGAANSPKTNVGGEHPVIDNSDNGDHDPLVQGLRALGHRGQPRLPVQWFDGDRAQQPLRLGGRGRPAPRGIGDGRHWVSAARIAQLSESDWQLFAAVRLRALTDSLARRRPAVPAGSLVHRRAVAPAAARPRPVRGADRRSAGRPDRRPAGEHRNRVPVLVVARPRRPRPRPRACPCRRGRGLGETPGGAHGDAAGGRRQRGGPRRLRKPGFHGRRG